MFVDYSFFEMFLWYMALASSIIFVLRLILMLFSGDGFDHDIDIHQDAGHSDSSFKMLSLNGIICFVMTFGWVTLALIREQKFDKTPAFLIGIAVGIVMVFILSYLLSLVKKFEGSSKVKSIQKGTKAIVYRTIPKDGVGEIIIENVFIKARADEEIASFLTVEVLEDAIASDILKVKKV